MSRVRTEDDGNTIACPHCGAENDDLWDHDWTCDDETIGTDCGTCGKTFSLTRTVSVDYTAEAEVSDDDVPDAPKNGPWCGADSPEHWGCTRSPLHLGDHAARAAGPEIIARWPQ